MKIKALNCVDESVVVLPFPMFSVVVETVVVLPPPVSSVVVVVLPSVVVGAVVVSMTE